MSETNEQEELSPEVTAQVQNAVRLARSVRKAVTTQEDGDLEGHSFDEDDILERHPGVNGICSTC